MSATLSPMDVTQQQAESDLVIDVDDEVRGQSWAEVDGDGDEPWQD